jgi:hypothetical protein
MDAAVPSGTILEFFPMTRIAIAGLAATSANDDEELEQIPDRGRQWSLPLILFAGIHTVETTIGA